MNKLKRFNQCQKYNKGRKWLQRTAQTKIIKANQTKIGILHTHTLNLDKNFPSLKTGITNLKILEISSIIASLPLS
jgi:hypothetical protein